MRVEVARCVEDRRRQYRYADPGLRYISGDRHPVRVALGWPVTAERGTCINHRRQHIERQKAFRQRGVLIAQTRPA